jgi:site-specific DNA-methyltransferase (adenine-specific)
MQIDPVIVVGGARVFAGDCREVLKGLPDNSVDSIVTDPPYELGFMGKKWDSSGIAYDVTVWQECLRVLKPGGHLLAFGGSRTYHRLGVAIEDAGFEIRDTIAWISSKTFPKSLNVSKAIDKKLGAEREVVGSYTVGGNALTPIKDKGGTFGVGSPNSPSGELYVTTAGSPEGRQWEGWGTGLKQVVEPVVMARKPLDGTVAENTLRWGVGGINIDGSRIAHDEPIKVMKAQDGGNKVFGQSGRYEATTELKPSGRWPANVILDEVSAGFVDQQSGVSTSGAAGKNASSGFPGGGYDGDYSVPYGDTGGASRFFYVAKASKRDRNEGLEELDDGRVGSFNGNVDETPGRKIGANPDKPNLPGKNTHPTVKPTQLMRYLIKLVTPPGGTVLDPFTGSGSTGKAALLDGFQFVGIELTEEYLPIIEGRLRWATEQGDDDDTLF